MTDDRTTADALRDHPDLARFASSPRGRALLSHVLAQQRSIRDGYSATASDTEARMARDRELLRQTKDGIVRCDEAIGILERALGSIEA